MFKDFNKENEITNVELQDIALRHLNGIFVPENVTSDENVSNEIFATVLKKFEGYGYTFDKELAKTLYALNTEKLKKISDVFLEVVRKFKSDNAYTVFYRNFPEEVMNLSEMETYFLQFLPLNIAILLLLLYPLEQNHIGISFRCSLNYRHRKLQMKSHHYDYYHQIKMV